MIIAQLLPLARWVGLDFLFSCLFDWPQSMQVSVICFSMVHVCRSNARVFLLVKGLQNSLLLELMDCDVDWSRCFSCPHTLCSCACNRLCNCGKTSSLLTLLCGLLQAVEHQISLWNVWWFGDRLSLSNPAKSVFLIPNNFRAETDQIQVRIADDVIPASSTAKMSWCHLWSDYLSGATNQTVIANAQDRLVFLINGHQKPLTEQARVLFHKCIIQPELDYCSIAQTNCNSNKLTTALGALTVHPY